MDWCGVVGDKTISDTPPVGLKAVAVPQRTTPGGGLNSFCFSEGENLGSVTSATLSPCAKRNLGFSHSRGKYSCKASIRH